MYNIFKLLFGYVWNMIMCLLRMLWQYFFFSADLLLYIYYYISTKFSSSYNIYLPLICRRYSSFSASGDVFYSKPRKTTRQIESAGWSILEASYTRYTWKCTIPVNPFNSQIRPSYSAAANIHIIHRRETRETRALLEIYNSMPPQPHFIFSHSELNGDTYTPANTTNTRANWSMSVREHERNKIKQKRKKKTRITLYQLVEYYNKYPTHIYIYSRTKWKTDVNDNEMNISRTKHTT